MKIVGEPKAFLSNEALQLLNLYESLGQRAEIFLPRHIFDNLTSFVSLCMEEPDDPGQATGRNQPLSAEVPRRYPGIHARVADADSAQQLEGFRAEQQARRIRQENIGPARHRRHDDRNQDVAA